MRFASEAVKAGFKAFQDGAAISSCPVEDDDTLKVVATHGGKILKHKVWVGIPWRQMWRAGWGVGALKKERDDEERKKLEEDKWLGHS